MLISEKGAKNCCVRRLRGRQEWIITRVYWIRTVTFKSIITTPLPAFNVLLLFRNEKIDVNVSLVYLALQISFPII